MENIFAVYNEGSEEDFELSVPLTFVGEHNKKLGFKTNFHVLVLDGFEKFSNSYKIRLSNLGLNLIDVSSIYLEVLKENPGLQVFTEYHRKCFLRWLVIEKFFSSESVIHYDADIVFNEDPHKIIQYVKNFTYVLQGCPAMTVINDRNWFKVYRQELYEYQKNPTNYSKKAWLESSGWEENQIKKWAGYRINEKLNHDQDLIAHLIHTSRLPQSEVVDIERGLSDYIVFQNPLYLHTHNRALPYTYTRRNGIDYMSEKKVLLWHMQSDFCLYLAQWVIRKNYLKIFDSQKRLDLAGKNIENKILKISKKLSSGRSFSRKKLYQEVFVKSDFGSLMSSEVWWKNGVFS